MTAVALLLLLTLTGAPLARRVAGTSAEMVVLAPLISAALLAAAATVEVAVGGRFVVWGTAALVAGAVLPFVPRTRVPRRQASTDVLLLAGPCVVLVWTLSTLQRYHVGWDGRSIWFFHGRMLMAGQDEYVRIAGDFPFTHADYPPLLPAVLAFAWELTTEIDYRTGQVLVAALTACATVLAAVSLARALRWRCTGVMAATAAVAVCYGVWEGAATNGYADPLVAALVLAGAGFGVLAGGTRRNEALGLSCLVMAGLTKNEGVPYAAMVLTVMFATALLSRRQRAPDRTPLSRYVLAAAALTLWPLVVRAHGLSSGLSEPDAPADRAGRLAVALDALLPTLDLVLWSGAGLLVACLVVADHRVLRGVLYAVALLACTGVLLSAYAFGPYEIRWWLGTSLGRTSMVLRAGGLLLALFAAGTAAEFALRRTSPRCATGTSLAADGPAAGPLPVEALSLAGSSRTAATP